MKAWVLSSHRGISSTAKPDTILTVAFPSDERYLMKRSMIQSHTIGSFQTRRSPSIAIAPL